MEYLFILITIFGSLMFNIALVSSSAFTVINQNELTLKTFKNCCGDSHCVSDGPNYFRYLVPSSDRYLYVGAMNYIFKLNFSTMQCDGGGTYNYLPPGADDKRRCALQGKLTTPDCQNHVRVIMDTGDNHLYVCSTGGYAPRTYKLKVQDLQPNSTTEEMAMCPYDPLDNTTAIKIATGNPGDTSAMYYGYYTDFIKNFPVFIRPKYTHLGITYPEKKTDIESVNWLNSVQFVASFDVDNMVMIFFREKAVEYIEDPHKIYSRVAKVCKKDLGGGTLNTIKKKWLSFQKARLVCSLPGKSPYYFDEIYDAYESDGYFFGLFYKQGAGLDASAICKYKMDDIKQVFSGYFKYKNPSNARWETLPVVQNPDPRLDNCDLHDSNPSVFVGKSSEYQLMDNPVLPVYQQPIFYKHGVQLMRFIVGEKVNDSRNIYVASDKGEIYDIFLKTGSRGTNWNKPVVVHNAVYKPFGRNNYPVWSMKLHDNELIMGTDYEVKKMNLDICTKILEMDTCIYNTRCKIEKCEPSTWKCVTKATATCPVTPQTEKDHTIVDEQNSLEKLLQDCHLIDSVAEQNHEGFEGVYSTLTINRPLRSDEIIWIKDDDESFVLNDDSDKYALTAKYDLIIKNTTKADTGKYTAKHRGSEWAKYKVKINLGNDTELVWKQQFVDWAAAFNTWKGCASNYLDSCQSNGQRGSP